jgi:hypothetical protein
VRRTLALTLALGILLATGAAPAVARVNLPVGTDADYQLGGDSSVPAGVGIVERDGTSRPLGGHYNICYVNGFQTQADERSFWNKHPRLILRRHGHRVVDSAWGEWLLDLRTKKKRRALARIVGAWTQGCQASGFDAVEYDNLDSFTRSHGLLKRRQALAYARLLVARAHAVGIAAGQKNLAGYDGRRVGYDFAIAEECGRYRECGGYTKFYGRRVVVIEYRRQDFDWTCAHYGPSLPVELRDLDLTPRGVHDWC